MAKQAGPIKIIGTIDDICFYKMLGEYYARMVHRHNSKLVKTSPRFALTMVYAGLLARASKIGSAVYNELPKDFRQFWMYRAFTGEAMQLLKQNKTDEEAFKQLWCTYASVHYMTIDTSSTRSSEKKTTTTATASLFIITTGNRKLTGYGNKRTLSIRVADLELVKHTQIVSHSPPAAPVGVL
jgi:hypothetical protein